MYTAANALIELMDRYIVLDCCREMATDLSTDFIGTLFGRVSTASPSLTEIISGNATIAKKFLNHFPHTPPWGRTGRGGEFSSATNPPR